MARKNENAAGLLAAKIAHVADFVSKRVLRRSARLSGVYDIDDLRARLDDAAPGDIAYTVGVRGVFAPAVLLASGWWERDRVLKLHEEPKFKDPLQPWLYTGFQEWGPSWDFTSETSSRDHILLGQVGSGDEVNSLLVAVVGEQADHLRATLPGRSFAFGATITGLLCPRSNLNMYNSNIARIVAGWGSSFNYCLLLDDELHRLRPEEHRPRYYSGYLWQCWCPVAAFTGQPPALKDCYFTWEHTDFTNSEAVDYNLDSLNRKADYLRERVGEMILVQKSSRLVPGEPKLSSRDFRRILITKN